MPNQYRAISAIAATGSAGFVMLMIVSLSTRFLTPTEQGLFFAFLSFGALAQSGDFGLSYAVLQKACRLGNSPIEYIENFVGQVRRWAFMLALLSVFIAGVSGFISFKNYSITNRTDSIIWLAPWVIALTGIFLGLYSAPLISLMEGSGKVSAAWRIRMLQAWVGGLACIFSLIQGWNLFGIAFFWLGSALTAFPFLINFPTRRVTSITKQKMNWREEIWPFQWRIGLSNISGFLIYRASTIIVFSAYGSIVAGQYGLALAAMNMILAVTTSWPNSQATSLGQLIASGKYKEAFSESKSTLIWSSCFSIFAYLLAFAIFGFASYRNYQIADRIVDLCTLAAIFLTGFISHVVACQAVFLRAQAKEPLLGISIFGGIANILGGTLAAKYGNIYLVATSGLVCAAFGLLVCTYLYLMQHHHFCCLGQE